MMGRGNVASSFVEGITNNTHWLRKAKRYLITIMMSRGNDVASSFVGGGGGGGGITNNTHWLRKAKRYLITIMMGCGNV